MALPKHVLALFRAGHRRDALVALRTFRAGGAKPPARKPAKTGKS